MLNSKESQEHSNYFLPPKETNKKTLVLDLDETLVHSQFFEFSIPSDITIKIEIEKEIYDIHVLVRPGVEKFIETMKDYYEIIIFTASISKYADILMNIIDPNKYCPYRLFREHCSFVNNNYVKDLTRLGRDLKDIVIVDNSPLSYSFHPNNGLPILSWFDDYNDNELDKITPILIFLSNVEDVREYIPKLVKNNEISYLDAEKLLEEQGLISDYFSSQIIKTENILENSKQEKSLKTSISKDEKENNDNENKKKIKKLNINIQIVQNNINNINNIISGKQNKDMKNKLVKYLEIINNSEQNNSLKQNKGEEDAVSIKHNNIITNMVNPNINLNTSSNKANLNKKGHKRQNTFNVNLNNSNLIKKYKEGHFVKINNLNSKNMTKKSIKEGKNNSNNNQTYFQHIKNMINKKRKRIKTPTSLNTIEFISNSNKYNFLKIKNKNNFSSKSQKRNKSNNKERTKLLIPLESTEFVFPLKIKNLSNNSKKGSISINNKKKNQNKINKIKIISKYNSISNRKSPYINNDFLNISINVNNYSNKNGLKKLFKGGQKILETHHKKQKSLNEINFISKLKNNLIKRNEIKSIRVVNKNDLSIKEKQKNVKSNHKRLNTNINEFKTKLIKKNYGNIKKINLKNLDFITKKFPKKIKINFKYKKTENTSNPNYKNLYHFYRTIDRSEPKKEKENIIGNISDNLMNKSYRKISHQKTISYNVNSSLNISNILNPRIKFRQKLKYNITSKTKSNDNQKGSNIINKNNKIISVNKIIK